MKLKEKVGFIGYGNMGSVIIDNILLLDLIENRNIIISNRNLSKLNNIKENYPEISITSDNSYLASISDKIFIFVEPQQMKNVMIDISQNLTENKHIIHICAGLKFKDIDIRNELKITQVIPTIVSKIHKSEYDSMENNKTGVSLIIHNENTTIHDKKFVENLFNEFSHVKNIKNENNEFEIGTILTSCGPAFIGLLLSKIAIISSNKSSLAVEDIQDMILKTLSATTSYLSYAIENSEDTENNKNKNINSSAYDLMSKIATKKGITQEGIDYLDPRIEEIVDDLSNKLLKRF
ncbi:NAD(P)-binding domain-containing protein [Methanobrevibacter filiformis]|uniref:Pyrroline-5-carboxylate reductase n=1 Tax=Methanobrevibacter filiformis TaxID=55758 RepID=A0A166FD20_9EURY|nr:NAD(P)-binding domain-containing protein [Methanobrevibacter filiformis]KZX17552.1 pyrroline-5-carboxylate reductase [Methanobrevibacter filiformis]